MTSGHPLFSTLSSTELLPATAARLNLQSVVKDYLNFYASGSSHTAKAKRLDTDRFLEFLKILHQLPSIEDLTVSHWDFSASQRFVDDRLRRGESPTTVARRLATLKHMGRALAERVSGFINPARDVAPPKVRATRPKALSPEETTTLRTIQREKAGSSGELRFRENRNRTMIELLLETGLRADEVRLLRKAQLDENTEWLKQVRTKGRRFRNVYLSSTLRDALSAYLKARSQELARFFPALPKTIDEKLPLFISTHGAKSEDLLTFEMSPKTVWRVVRDASIDTKLHPHLLRHTFATDLIESSKDVRLVAQALGHSDVRTTMRYTERTDEEIAKAIEQKRK